MVLQGNGSAALLIERAIQRGDGAAKRFVARGWTRNAAQTLPARPEWMRERGFLDAEFARGARTLRTRRLREVF